MHLIRDVLDNQLVDRDQEKVGRVDGIVIELRDDKPPRLVGVELGAEVLARRMGKKPGEWAARYFSRFKDRRKGKIRILWSRVMAVGIDVEVDLGPQRDAVMAWEEWMSLHVAERMPGGGG